MAVIGDAYIVVRALTKGFKETVEKDLKGMGGLGEKAGKDLSDGLARGSKSGRGLKGIISPDLAKDAEKARLLFRKLTIATNFLVPAITGVLGAIGSLGSGLFVLVGVLGNAAKGSIVLVAGLMALAQAAATVKLAFQGVGDAISAGNKAGEDGVDTSDAQAAAARRLRDARLALKRLLEEEKPEALAAAREDAVRAEEAAADALLNTERATRTYNEAQRRSLRALDNLNKAREDAKEKIQQLRFELEGGAISERKARLEFEKARDSLQRVQDLPPNSRARQEAELAFAEADLNLRKAIDRNQDLKKEEEASTKAGVEGAQEVVDAKQDILDAQQGETDAGIAATKAIRDAARARADAEKAAAAAAAGGSVERELNRRIADAREEVELAQQAAAKAASGGIDAYRKALEKLSPEAQSFVKFIVSQKDAFDGLRAAAGRDLFPKLETALTTIIGSFDALEPLIQATGDVLGDLAIDFANAFFQGAGFERLKSVWSTNNGLLDALGDTVINLLEGLLILLQAAEPLITAFGDWARETSEAWKNTLLLKEQTGELAGEFANIQSKISALSSIFGTYKEAFGEAFAVINAPGGAGDQLLSYFQTAADEFLAFIQAGSADGSLDTFFKDSVTNFTKVLDILGAIIGDLLLLGASPGVGQFLDGIKGAVDVFGELGQSISGEDGPVAKLGEFIELFATLIKNTTESGALNAFFDTLNSALTSINAILENETVQAILKAIAPIFGFLLAFGIVLRSVQFFGKVILGVFNLAFGPLKAALPAIKAILGGMGSFGAIVLKIGGFLAKAFSFLIKFAGPIGFIISLLLIFVPIIIENWEGILAFFTGLWESISSGISSFFDGVVQFFSDGFNFILGLIQPFIDFFIGYFTTAFDIIRGIVDVFVAIFQIAFVLIATVVQFVWDGIKAGFKAVADFLSPIIKGIGDFFRTIFKAIGDFIMGIWKGIQAGFQAFVNFIKPGIDAIFGFFKNVFDKVVGFFKGIVNTLIGFAEGFINFFIDGLNMIIGAINKLKIPIPEIVRGLFGGAKELGFNIQPVQRIRLARLAEGGVVKATPGGIAAVIGEGGRAERIEPLDKDGLSVRDRAIIAQLSGNGGATINVYPSAGMNERELAELVSRRLAFELRRGAA
jgi:phage-related protein